MARTSLSSRVFGSFSLRSFALLGALATLGGALTVVAAREVRKRETERAHYEFARRAADATNTLFEAFATPVEVALGVRALVETGVELDDARFADFTEAALTRHPSIAALEWAPRVGHAERAGFEARIGGPIVEGAGDRRMVPARTRPEYFPLLLTAPRNPAVKGLDIGFEPGRRAMIDAAIASGHALCSPRFQLVEDAPGIHSVAIYAPAFAGRPTSPEARRRALLGFGITLFRLRPVIESALRTHDLSGLGFRLEETGAAGSVLHEHEFARIGSDELAFERERSFLGRNWKIRWRGDPAAFLAQSRATFVLVSGLLATLVLIVVVIAALVVARLRRQIHAALRLGNYTLIEKLGEGGMGTVYLAEHALLRRQTAVKLIRADAQSPAAEERFLREVQYTSRLTHPNTIQVYDYGRTSEGVFYYAMEYIEGVTLEALVQEIGPLEPARAVFVMRQVAGSLAEAHERGVVHRDLKPENVMLCQRGGLGDFVKVLDFGLVKQFTNSDETTLSSSTSLVGTPAYMAPEAMVSATAATPASDVYALGAILYFLITGTQVFGGSTLISLMARTLKESPEPPSARLGRVIPDGLSEVVLHCLEKEPSARPKDAAALLRELDAKFQSNDWDAERASEWWKSTGKELRARFEKDRTLRLGKTESHVIEPERGRSRVERRDSASHVARG